MRILITTGLGQSDIGGPFQYAPNLEKEFLALGHEVRIAKFDSVEHSVLCIWPNVFWADRILALDTFSVGFPAVLAARFFGKKIIMRVGGDFVWSAYVNRTGEPIALSQFYLKLPKFNLKEKIIFLLSRWTIRNTDFLAFNTEWQRKIWSAYYQLSKEKTGVVRNFIPNPRTGSLPATKNFLWAGRLIPEKNIEMLKKFNVEIVTGESHEKVLEKIKNAYAVVSLAFTDICPNFVLEGVSFGKPFVMTQETGLNEVIPQGGIFVNPVDEVKIKQALESLENQSTYNKYVEELKGINLGRSWSKLAEEFVEIWNSL